MIFRGSARLLSRDPEPKTKPQLLAFWLKKIWRRCWSFDKCVC